MNGNWKHSSKPLVINKKSYKFSEGVTTYLYTHWLTDREREDKVCYDLHE